MEENKIKKTIITIEVLSSHDESLEGLSLEEIGREMDYGSMVGTFSITQEELLSNEDAKLALYEMGSDPEFFQELVENDNNEPMTP